MKFDFSSDDPTPRFSVENKKSVDTTGNIIIDNDMQQESERCERLRNQLRSKDVSKLRC